MASHLRSIVEHCSRCGAPAQFELYSSANAPTGRYCRKHALSGLKTWREMSGEQPPTREDVPS